MAEYDPKTCVTAGELRSIGLPIPDSIPDVAYIPHYGITAKLIRISGDDADGEFDAVVDVTFVEPFRWISLKLVVEGGTRDDESTVETREAAAPVEDLPNRRFPSWLLDTWNKDGK